MIEIAPGHDDVSGAREAICGIIGALDDFSVPNHIDGDVGNHVGTGGGENPAVGRIGEIADFGFPIFAFGFKDHELDGGESNSATLINALKITDEYESLPFGSSMNFETPKGSIWPGGYSPGGALRASTPKGWLCLAGARKNSAARSNLSDAERGDSYSSNELLQIHGRAATLKRAGSPLFGPQSGLGAKASSI